MTGVISWIGTWLVVIAAMIWLSNTRWGRPIVYYLLWLSVVLLIVGNADELTGFFNAKALQLNG
jgi:hypothetical protein